MPLVRVDPEVYSGLKVLLSALRAVGRARTLGDVVKYLLSLSPLEDLLSAGSGKELALLYAQLASKSWEAVNEELVRACIFYIPLKHVFCRGPRVSRGGGGPSAATDAVIGPPSLVTSRGFGPSGLHPRVRVHA